jgi:hypothetical protein
MRNNEERLGTNLPRQDSTPQIQQVGISAPLEFMNPTEVVLLPSKGLLYPPHHPLYKKDSIEIKQMTAKEEDILSSRNLLKKGVVLDKLIQALVFDKNINTDTLTTEDRNAILVAARISAYGNKYLTQVTCPSCYEKVKNSFDLNEKLEKAVEDRVEVSTSFNEDGTFAFTLPSTKWNVVCRALNGYDEKELLRISEVKKKSSAGNDSLLIEQLRMMIVSIQQVTDKDVITKAVEAMPASDAKYLRNAYQQTVPNVDLNHTFVCSKCDYETTMEVPLTADFFWFK